MYFTIIIFCLILVIAGAFVIRSKLVKLVMSSINLLFTISMLLALFSLFFFTPFELAADFTWRQTGTLERLRELDDQLLLGKIDQISEKSDELIDKFKDFFGGKDNSDSDVAKDSGSSGLLQSQLYPMLVTLLAWIYRITLFLFSLTSMLLALYLSYISSAISQLSSIEKRVAALEETI